ncbi:MAG: hypothetical protein M8349_03540 [ANME-2 cluster archaeon]|nr:hypothetical protein [ANME-2 cluster archaeon]
MKIVNIGIICIIMWIFILGALQPVAALEVTEPLINGTGLYLSSGQTWTFYQGYSLTLKSVSNNKDRAWVQLKLNDTVVKSAILSLNEVFYYNMTKHYNMSNYSIETVQFSLKVSGLYSGENAYLVTFSPVYQYYDPALPDPTPTPTARPDDLNNSNGTPTATGGMSIPGFQIISTAMVLCFCSILLHRLNEKFSEI